MIIKVERKYKKDSYTIGTLSIDGKFICNTIEDKDYGFTTETPIAEIKKAKAAHPQQVAIPSGRYEVSVKYYRGMATKYPYYQRTSCKGHIPCLLNVPGYEGILIHCGSTAASSAGCVIVGFNTKKGELTDSKKAFTLVCDKIMEANKKGEKVWIEIG